MEMIGGSASFATKAVLFEIAFLAQRNMEALAVTILKAVAAETEDVGLTVLSTGQSVT